MNPRFHKTQKTILFVAGAILVAVGAFILIAPQAFFAINQIDLDADVSLINELKASAALLLGAGAFILTGVLAPRLSDAAAGLAALIYLSYAASRFLSMAVDGMPAQGLVQAAVLEGVIGLVCLVLLVLRREPRARMA